MKRDVQWNDSVMCRLMPHLHAGVTGTREELAELVGTSPRNLEAYLPLLHKHGLVRVLEWHISDMNGSSFKGVYGFGEGKKHAPRPTKARRKVSGYLDASHSAMCKQALMLLRRGLNTAMLMSKFTGKSVAWERKILASLHRQGFIHICGWDREGRRPPVAVFAPGRGEDAPRPPKRTVNECNIVRRARLDEEYGPAIAKRILTPRAKGGPERIVVDGKTVWARGKSRGNTNHDANEPNEGKKHE